jgi:hypothetical protein
VALTVRMKFSSASRLPQRLRMIRCREAAAELTVEAAARRIAGARPRPAPGCRAARLAGCNLAPAADV